MEGVDTVWRRLQESGRPFGPRENEERSSLSRFQFPKQKKCGAHKEKVFNMQQALKSPSATPTMLLSSARVLQPGISDETESAPPLNEAYPRKLDYNPESWQSLASIVHRQANSLKEDSNNARRNKGLSQLKEIFIDTKLPYAFYEKAFPFLFGSLLLCLSDPTESARHLAANLICKFASEIADVDSTLSMLLEALVPRFCSKDIDGVAHLPLIMRPEPEYKPLQLTPVEKSEDVRKLLLNLLRIVLDRCSDECVLNHLDLITGLLRAGAMDVCPEIKVASLRIIVEFCDRHRSMLLHFTEPLTRSLLSCLVYQHAKLRLEALRALTHVLACGLYKYTGEIVQMLAGWRDPNLVPIKSLYETTTIRNYFAELLADHSPMVRMFFFDTLARWLLDFEDKADYETWVFPYLLSGLFDPFRPIQQLVFRLLERLGKHYELIHEKELREIKQLGALEPWSYEGRACIPFPLGGSWNTADEVRHSEEKEQFAAFIASYSERLSTLGIDGCSLTEIEKDEFSQEGRALVGDPARPCLGARTMVRTYFRRYAKTLFKPIEDFKEVTTTVSARLLVVSLAYVEDSFVEWLDDCISVCHRVLSQSNLHPEDAVDAYKVVMRLVGVFIDPKNYWGFVKDSLDTACTEETHYRIGMLNLLALMLEGSFKALHHASDVSLGLGRLDGVVPEIAEALARTDLLQERFVGCAARGCVMKILELIVSGSFRQNASFPERTVTHLLSVIGSLADPSDDVGGSENTSLTPQLQELLGKLSKCNPGLGNETAAAVGMGFMGFYVKLSLNLPPCNLAALRTFLLWSPPSTILEKESYDVALLKLEEFSSATQTAATRRGARRTALWLVRRLLLDQSLQAPEVSDTLEEGRIAGSDKLAKTPTSDHSPNAKRGMQNADCPKPPVEAAAQILSRVVLGSMKEKKLEDLEDILAALKEFLILPEVQRTAKSEAIQDTLVKSRLVEELSWLLQEPRLHTKLFCTACETYAHERAVTYPDKSPAAILEDMPLGKRRELRLCAIKTAAVLKQEAVLLLKVSLSYVSRHHDSLSVMINSAIAALDPPDRAHRRSAELISTANDAVTGESDLLSASQLADDQRDMQHEGMAVIKDRANASVTRNAMPSCQVSLPFQAPDPWFVFQTASFLVDAIKRGVACHNETEKVVSRSYRCQNDSSLPVFMMPVSWELPEYTHVQLQAARKALLGLSSDSDLCQVVDSCVRHVVELQGAVYEEWHKVSEDENENKKLYAEARENMRNLVNAAKSQIKGVAVEGQKVQARLALTQVIRFIRKIYPDAVQECLRQYDASGRFSRIEVLSRIF